LPESKLQKKFSPLSNNLAADISWPPLDFFLWDPVEVDLPHQSTHET
jgi:hypothetical protein